MKREIKFRFYSNADKKMYDWEWVRENLEIGDVSSNNIMQFTGLKDRQGKEIYEGDIIIGTKDGFGNVEEKIPFKVIFEDGGFFAKTDYPTKTRHAESYSLGMIAETYIDLEIVGNIYE